MTDPDVTFTMSLTDAQRLQRVVAGGIHTLPSIVAEEASTLIAYINFVVARETSRDVRSFIDGVGDAIAALNNEVEDEVTGIDLWYEHTGVVRQFDPTEQDPT